MNKLKKSNSTGFSYVSLAYTMGEVGFMIAVPLVISVLIGIKVDQFLKTTPLFIIVSMLFAVFISTLAIKKKIQDLNKLNGI